MQTKARKRHFPSTRLVSIQTINNYWQDVKNGEFHILLAGMSIKHIICLIMFEAASFTLAEKWEESKCPSPNEWIKMW